MKLLIYLKHLQTKALQLSFFPSVSKFRSHNFIQPQSENFSKNT